MINDTGSLIGLLDSHVSRHLFDKKIDCSVFYSDVLWHDSQKLLFKQAGSQRLMQCNFEALHRGELVCEFAEIPAGMEEVKVSYVWVHYTSQRKAVLWQDGRFTTLEDPDLVQRAFTCEISNWQMLRPVFKDIYLFCGLYSKTVFSSIFYLYDSKSSQINARSSVDLIGKNYCFTVDKLLEIKRSSRKVMMLAVGAAGGVHLLECSRDSITLINTNFEMPKKFTEICVVDNRGPKPEVIFGCGYHLYKLLFKFD